MTVLLLAATLLALAGAGLGALVSLVRGRRRLAAGLLAGAAAWGTLYGAGLLAVSLASRERVLAPGAAKRFCGFYLDCHLGVAVAGARTAETIGPLRPAGRFLIVTLAVSSDARRATLRPGPLDVRLVDGATRLARSFEAEAALARLEGRDGSLALERPVAPGGSYLVTVVFDVPAGDGPAPRLLVREDWGAPDRVLEGLLIGDEESFLHRPTLLALPT